MRDFDCNGLQLRHYCNLEEDEKKTVLELRNHPEVRRWMYTDQRIAWGEHIRFIDSLLEASSQAHWLVYDSADILGSVNLSRISMQHGHAYVGIYANPECEKRSKGKSLLEALKQVAFETLQLHTLKLEVLVQNRKAIAFYEKNGFSKEGILKGYIRKSEAFEDVVIMGCTQ